MGYQPRIKSPKGAIHPYKKPLREKRKSRKRIRKSCEPIQEAKHTATEREVSEVTLKRLHTLGNQRFGSFPFSEHFDRWLSNITAVLSEFESHPSISVDDKFIRERSEIFSRIKLQLEDRRRKEATINQETKNLSDSINHLKQINTDYSDNLRALRGRKNSEVKRLYMDINRLKRQQDNIIRMKTGFLRGISGREKEQKEIEIAQELNDKQKELELVMLNFKAKQKERWEEYENRREPVLEQIKFFQKRIGYLEDDGSLEERWFACEALIDVLNTFLQRKATQPHNS